ncbi:hypothetical protein BJG92_01733 [Arthrobacter sp. SO5]|nr:hypothetical protein [Arthrobacter sp. SO5]
MPAPTPSPGPILPGPDPALPAVPVLPDPGLPVIDPALPAAPGLPVPVPVPVPIPELVVIPAADPVILPLDPGLAGGTAALPMASAGVTGAPATAADCGVVSVAAPVAVAIEQPSTAEGRLEPYSRMANSGYAPAPDPSADQLAGAQQASTAPPAAPPVLPAGGAGDTKPPAGHDDPNPWHGGTGLPAPNALPAAPGSGSGNMHSSNGPSGAAAWIPNLYLVIPTAGADAIRGPLQHEHSAVSADPGSSPD